MSWLYRPNHPLADEFGMVEKHMVMPAESKTGCT
jgi:flagellar basal body rod protein FlgC